MKTLKFAVSKTVPILFTYLFIGIAFGMMMTNAGFSPLYSALCAVFIYAGSMQIVLVAMLQAGAPLVSVALMTFFVNARHLFYGLAFLKDFKKMGAKYPYMVFSLTDETYSILCSCSYPPQIDKNQASFAIALLNHLYWVIGCLAGAVMGNVLPFDLTGIDFSATAFFVVVCVNQWQSFPSHIPAVVGAVCALAFLVVLGPQNFLIPAMAVSMVVLMLLQQRVQPKLSVSNHE